MREYRLKYNKSHFSRRKLKKALLSTFIVCLLGIFIGYPIFSIWYNTSISYSKQYGLPELLYYTSQIIGVLVMSCTVVVAIFGQEIKRWFFGEKCTISLLDGGFNEKLGETAGSTSPEAQHYDCVVSLFNDGNKEITDCQLILKEVQYKETDDAKYKTIHKNVNRPLYWKVQDIKSYTLLAGESCEFTLFIIYPENSRQTPDDQHSSPLCMAISCCRLDEKHSKKGIWNAKYQIRSRDRILKNFEVTVRWDGTWYSRQTEMEEAVLVNIKEE